jgi:hypothetical protein
MSSNATGRLLLHNSASPNLIHQVSGNLSQYHFIQGQFRRPIELSVSTGANGMGGFDINISHTHQMSNHIHNNPAHTHIIIATGSIHNTGEGNSRNLQPYITCFIWKRIS